MRVAAVDPGKVNPAVWLGEFDMEQNTIKTDWGAAGEEITTQVGVDKALTTCEVGVRTGELLVSKCKEMGVCDLKGVVVETPSTFNGPGAFVNVGAAVGSGATYGFLRGAGVENVKMSNSRTKSKAINHFTELFGIELEQRLPGKDASTKGKNRLINKRYVNPRPP